MDSVHDRRCAREEGEHRINAGNQAVHALVELVRPLLVCRGRNPEVDIQKEILAPAHGCTESVSRELDSFCSACSMVLQRTAEAVVEAVAEYLCDGEGECAVLSLADGMECIGTVVQEAYESSHMRAFAITLKEQLCDERF